MPFIALAATTTAATGASTLMDRATVRTVWRTTVAQEELLLTSTLV
jgi:hypothetical protein